MTLVNRWWLFDLVFVSLHWVNLLIIWEAFNFAPCVCSGFICSFLSGSKRSEEQVNVTPATENYLQHNDKKGPRIDPTRQAFLSPRVILYENCNMRLSSFYTDNGTKLICWSEGGGELHTPSSTRHLSEMNTRESLSSFILIQDVFSDWCLIQMYLFSCIKICHQCSVLLSVRCLWLFISSLHVCYWPGSPCDWIVPAVCVFEQDLNKYCSRYWGRVHVRTHLITELYKNSRYCSSEHPKRTSRLYSLRLHMCGRTLAGFLALGSRYYQPLSKWNRMWKSLLQNNAL